MNALILNRAAEPPQDGWYQIEVTGEHPASANRIQVIDEAAMQAIVNRFHADRDAAGPNWAGMLVDGDHLSHDLDKTTEAMAWLQDLSIRNGELHGRLDLTDIGEPAIRNKRYKFFSTEYDPGDLEDLGGGRVRPRRLAGLAFTNRPNNRGAKPISNRDGTLPTGETKPKTETNKPTMKSIAEKLGLSAEATEADILNAITELQGKVAESEAKAAETEAEAIMNRFGDRIPKEKREDVKKRLIANREDTVALLELLPQPAAKQETTRICNREGATTPAAVTDGLTEDAKGNAQAALISQIRNRDRCSHTQAWDQARREKPELF